MRRPVPSLLPALAVLATLAGSPFPAQSQRVVGRVLERGGGGPVVGAMVRLEGADGRVGRGWLTAADGRFSLRAPEAGIYRLLVERIGFASTVQEGIELGTDAILSIDLVVETEPILLEGLEVSAEGGRCSISERSQGVQAVWDEARKALDAAAWTEDQATLRFQVAVWDRQVSARTSQILAEETDTRETIGANSVQSLPPADLVERGYVQSVGDFVFWYAPDAHVLLSEEFQRTHCFRLEEREEGGVAYVGLGFEPDRQRELPDVKGTIWLDTETARLESVEFDYENIDMPGASRARGEVRFAELADGRWIVSDWFIQAPMTGELRGRGGASRPVGLQAVHEVGNRVVSVEGEGLMWQPDTRPGTIQGMVYDSVSGEILGGAQVRVVGRSVRAHTGLDGRFELKGVPAGLHRLTFSHASVDSLGVTPGFTTVEVGEGATTEVMLALPRWVTMLAASCGEGGSGAIVGVVRTRSGRTLGGATVEAMGSQAAEGGMVSDISDSQGGFVLCGLPEGVHRVEASRGRARSDPVEVRTSGETFVQADLTLAPPPTVQASDVPGALRPAVVGTVLEQEVRRPLADVAVLVLDENGDSVGSDLTDAEGRFRIVLEEGLPTAYLTVGLIGFASAVSDSLDLTNGTLRVEVLLPQEAVEIAPVIVTVDGRVPELERVGFYARATQNPGLFIRRDDIEAVAPARTSDLLERAPGVRVMTNALAGDMRRRIVFNRLTLASGELCYPSVYVDGEMIRVGGLRETQGAPVIEGIDPPEEEDVPAIDQLVPPQEIEAVELYPTPGQVPRQFTGLGTRCGVVVIWTRPRGGGGSGNG